MAKKMIELIPIAMVRANIYAPSRHRKRRLITEDDFIKQYSDNPRAVLVSFAADGVSNPQRVTAYGFGRDAWWIVGN